MKIGITGVTGLIGQALAAQCQARGHSITGFSRRARQAGRAQETLPHCDQVRKFSLEHPVDVTGLDAIVHLAGEPVIGLWTAEKRRKIVASRRDTTRHLVRSLRHAPHGPSLFLSASGTGYYGDRGAEKLEENSGPGSGFLAEVAQVWEEEARAAEDAGVRACQLRTGMVLAGNGGAFPLLRRVFSLGLGGKMGGGQQFMPWIHLADIVSLYLHALENDHLSGPLNAAAPAETTNAAFTRALAQALHRPAFCGVPKWVLQTTLRELSTVVLDSQRVSPRQATLAGFAFRFPTLPAAFADLLGNA